MAKIICIKTKKVLHDDNDKTDDAYFKSIENKIDLFLNDVKEACMMLAAESPHYSFNEMVVVLPELEEDTTVHIMPPEMSIARSKAIIEKAYNKDKSS